MKIEKISIKKYKVFQDTEIKDLPNLCVFLGANGSGKSSLFDVFGFLSDSLKNTVKHALNVRGGFKEVISRGTSGAIEFEFKFRNEPGQPLITYELAIGLDASTHQPIVTKERLSYRRGASGKPFKFLDFANGEGDAIVNEEEFEEQKQAFKPIREKQTLASPDILAIKGLGQFQRFKAISAFRRLLDNWFISNFQIAESRALGDTGFSEHLSTTGDNLAQVTQYIYQYHSDIFEEILGKLGKCIPGITKVEAKETEDGRIVLRFQDGAFKDPFIARYVSDGTLKMFAYLILLHDPKPHDLLCIEEPENYLHPQLLPVLAEEFRAYASKGGQVFISTHSPDFVNALNIEELFWLNKKDGYTSIRRASEDDTIRNLVNAGDQLGYLWNQHYLIGSGPF